MLSPELRQIASTRISLELRDRERAFGKQVLNIREQATFHGHGRSSATALMIGEAIRQEVEVRAMIVWQTLSRVLAAQALPVDRQLGQALKDFVSQELKAGCGDLRSARGDLAEWAVMSIAPFEELEKPGIEKVMSEIDIALLAAGRQSAQGLPGTTVNIYQPYGIVQTGANSTASFVVSAEHKTAVLNALQAVEKAIATAPDAEGVQVAETRELVADARAELAKSSPNMLRLRSTLSGIAVTVQTLGSAAQAYTLLKGAAALLGVHLP